MDFLPVRIGNLASLRPCDAVLCLARNTLLLGVISWMVWRLWRFTIVPKLFPRDPRPLPYLIPWLGCTFEFFKDAHALLNSGLGNNPLREPFSITLAGEQVYIVVNPNDVAQVYKNNTSLSFDVFVQDLMLSCGTDTRTVEKMSEEPPRYIPGRNDSSLNPSGKSLVRLAVDFHHIQLLPGPNSQAGPLIDVLLGHIKRGLTWETLSQGECLGSQNSSKGIQVSLLGLCGRVLVEAGTKTYWGDKLWGLTPDMLKSFYALDRGVWKLLFQYPSVFSRDALAARDTIIDILTQYYRLPREEREDCAWFTKSLETESRNLGLGESDMSAAILIIFFVVNGNTYKFCFWVLCHLLSDPSLYASVKKEVFLENRTDGPSLEHLTNKCPILDSVLSEVLRLYSSSASMRYITEDTLIGGKILRKGRKIMLPYRQLHENQDVFGNDFSKFRPTRFIEKRNLTRSSSYRPFGGGATLCAGRFVARQEVLCFIGTALHQYDIERLEDPNDIPRFPRVDSAKPTFGIMAPLEGDDLRVYITPKNM
ncbi:hypothetical protein MferCBS31731_002281 [Microsporum ferrugineum]